MKLHKTYIHKISGFTLIEIIIAAAIIAIIGGLGLFIGIGQYSSHVLSAERGMIVGMLQKARNQSMNNINEAPHGVYIQTPSYILFQGASYASRNVLFDEILPKAPFVTIGGNQEIVFNQLRGNVSVGEGDITISNGTRTHTISVNSEGRINW